MAVDRALESGQLGIHSHTLPCTNFSKTITISGPSLLSYRMKMTNSGFQGFPKCAIKEGIGPLLT